MDQTEWETLDAIRRELNGNLMEYDWMAQDKSTELLVKSLEGKGDRPPSSVSRPT